LQTELTRFVKRATGGNVMSAGNVRSPAVAGLFYPSSADELKKVISACFESPYGPGALRPNAAPAACVAGLMCPHAGYVYSGPTAAHAFAALSASPTPEVVVIIGPNHRGLGSPLAVPECSAWQTPIGTMPIDTSLRSALLQAAAGVSEDDVAFQSEHSHEVMLPFLQVVCHPEVPILPIAWGRLDLTAIPFGHSLASVLAADSRRILLLASTDMSHYVPAETARQLDGNALKRIADMDAEGLIREVRQQRITMCGVAPTAVVMTALSTRNASAEILAYGTSGDATGDQRNVVGYAAAVFRTARA
jgi:AmmeMemoRadiSam system protein B